MPRRLENNLSDDDYDELASDYESDSDVKPSDSTIGQILKGTLDEPRFKSVNMRYLYGELTPAVLAPHRVSMETNLQSSFRRAPSTSTPTTSVMSCGLTRARQCSSNPSCRCVVSSSRADHSTTTCRP
jgi:hypothetical protein